VGTEARIQLAGVSFAHPGRQVFDRFDLEVAAGEHLAVFGPSGCGKTTLLHLLCGLLQPQSGQVRCCGAVMSGISTDRALVFQDLALFPWYSALGNVAYGLARQGVPRPERERRAGALLARFGITGVEALRHPHALSGGQRQRVALARALITSPRVLLLDEPSAALDAAAAILIQSELRRMQDEAGFACVTVTHRVDEALDSADRCLVLSGHPACNVFTCDLRTTDRAAVAAEIRAHLNPKPRTP
jgi:NitT/TauT family transport system ATP-binding protein